MNCPVGSPQAGEPGSPSSIDDFAKRAAAKIVPSGAWYKEARRGMEWVIIMANGLQGDALAVCSDVTPEATLEFIDRQAPGWPTGFGH